MADSSQPAPQWRSRTPQSAVLKQREAQRLREVEGLTYQQIAERLGYANKSTAKRAYDKAVADGDLMDLTDADWRNLQLRRLERLYAIAAKHAETSDDPLGAVEKAGRIHDRIVRLRGLEIVPVRNPNAPDVTPDRAEDSDAGDSNVITAEQLAKMRERRARGAADRAAGR